MVARGPFRKTRHSFLPDTLAYPCPTVHVFGYTDGLVHQFVRFETGGGWDTCCRLQMAGITHSKDSAPNCFACALCKGCYACNPNHISAVTLSMGKWETKDGRRLYPFEMDAVHLVNAINKLKRDKTHFKDDWEAWVKVLEVEARLRKLV